MAGCLSQGQAHLPILQGGRGVPCIKGGELTLTSQWTMMAVGGQIYQCSGQIQQVGPQLTDFEPLWLGL